jgi:gamma-glutamylcyclotransferase (GGCT)/AIG2-like uncharacterized protein YtfP
VGIYPALIDGNDKIEGELLLPADPEAFFSDIDRLEGFHGFGAPRSLFRRIIVKMESDGQLAWIYHPLFDTSDYPDLSVKADDSSE